MQLPPIKAEKSQTECPTERHGGVSSRARDFKKDKKRERVRERQRQWSLRELERAK